MKQITENLKDFNKLYFRFIGIKSIFKLTLSFVFMLGLSYFIYLIPSLLLNGYSWGTVFVWSPNSVQLALYSLYFVGWFTYIFIILKFFFKTE